MITIQNNTLLAVIQSKGAEMQRLFHKGNQLEYLWSGNPLYWPKYSPVLFPIVGMLKKNTYYYNGSAYTLSRHGFARDRIFEVEEQDEQTVSLVLKSDPESKQLYPFDFLLRITYQLEEATLQVTYTVENPADVPLYFSIGGHPAFRVPLVTGDQYADYYLLFDKPETADRWMIKDDLIDKPVSGLENEDRLWLRYDLFYEDALVFKNLRSSGLSLQNVRNDHGLHFNYSGFPYLGIWAAKDADFVCIEPWCGLADAVDHGQQLEKKEGILMLEGGQLFKRSWEVTCY